MPETSGATVPAQRLFKIIPCTSAKDIQAAKTLFRAYTTWLDLDLTFQDLATELASMPGKYAAERGGCLLLARDEQTGDALGVMALRALPSVQTSGDMDQSNDEPLQTQTCEVKRLYVAPEGRGRGVGRALAEAVIERATELGYAEMKLDTLPRMGSARRLYEELGFQVCERYYETPLEGTIFMKKILSSQSKP